MLAGFKSQQTQQIIFIYFNDTNKIKNIYNINFYIFNDINNNHYFLKKKKTTIIIFFKESTTIILFQNKKNHYYMKS